MFFRRGFTDVKSVRFVIIFLNVDISSTRAVDIRVVEWKPPNRIFITITRIYIYIFL